MKRRLARAIAEHVHSAQYVYETCGHLTPKLWVHGDGLSRIAEPATHDGARASDLDRARLLCAMRAEHGGTIVGRSDEVWVRLGDDLPTLPGSLSEHAETDPSICTGLLVVALDVRHAQMAAVVTRQALLDDGTTEWRLAPIAERHAESLLAVLLLAESLTCVGFPEPHADEIGWHLEWA